MNRQGFALLEFTIVIIIIAFVMGGVVYGKDLAHQWELRKAVSQIGALDSAVTAFKLKNQCVPGDCKDADSRGLTSFDGKASAAGNGNGYVDLFYSVEAMNAMHQLAESKLIKDVRRGVTGGLGTETVLDFAYDSRSATTNEQGYWVMGSYQSNDCMMPGGNFFWATAAMGAGERNGSAFLLASDAYSIDRKIDDALPRSGKMLASGSDVVDLAAVRCPEFDPVGGVGPAGPFSNVCVSNDSTPLYNVLNKSGAPGSLCTIAVKSTQ